MSIPSNSKSNQLTETGPVRPVAHYEVGDSRCECVVTAKQVVHVVDEGPSKPAKVKPAKVKPAKVKPAKVKPAKVELAKAARCPGVTMQEGVVGANLKAGAKMMAISKKFNVVRKVVSWIVLATAMNVSMVP